jgi:hypothetical protein
LAHSAKVLIAGNLETLEALEEEGSRRKEED